MKKTYQYKQTIELWIKKLNNDAELRRADIRCGRRYAVCVNNQRLTDFLPLPQLEQFLLGVFYSNEFYDKIKP